MDNVISEKQRNYYQKKAREIQIRKEKKRIENEIVEQQKIIQCYEQIYKLKNREDKIIGLQTS
ncbi:MAG: hypothetical protein L0L22_14405, partial [Staphylococcus equorum]|nr:hypothetical protein [Staphylococcus equorum]